MSEDMHNGNDLENIYESISEAVVSFDINECIHLCIKAIEANADPLDVMLRGLSKGMEKVKKLYQSHHYYIPELLLCSDALYAGLNVLKPCLEKNPEKKGRKIIIGVVEGDIHDIGKNLVKAMFIAKGWDVYDLGNDVRQERFVEELQETGAELVALSALMSTSMFIMPELINKLKKSDSNVRIIAGGAPLSEESAKNFGADGYAPDASTAVEIAELLFNVNS